MALRLTLRRLVAYGVDVALLAVVLLPISFAAGNLLGTTDVTGPEIWIRSLVLVSVPAWAYFIAAEVVGSGRTIGKRVLGLRTIRLGGQAPELPAAVTRTAVKLLPWELIHLAFFALSIRFGELAPIQVVVGGAAYVLMFVYLAVALRTGGARSIPDLVASTRVVRADR